jgi:hypothetical protein
MTWLLGANVGKQLYMDDYIYIITHVYISIIYISYSYPSWLAYGWFGKDWNSKTKPSIIGPCIPYWPFDLAFNFGAWKILEVHNSHIGYMVNLSLSLFVCLFLFVFLANRSYDSLSDICRCLHVCCSRILQNEETNYLLATKIGPQ